MTSPDESDSDTPRSLLDRIARPSLALGAGALVALSLPPWGFWPLALIGIALFDLTLSDTTTSAGRARRGWLFGAGWMYLGMGWMVQLTGPGYVAAAGIFAGFHALAAVIGTTSAAGGAPGGP